MKVLFTLLAVALIALMLPTLLVIGIALGPAALVILFVAACAALVLLLDGAMLRHNHRTRVPPLHG